MKMRSRIIAVLLLLAAFISLILPIRTLFIGDGVYAWFLKQDKSTEMLLEIAVLFVITGAAFFLITDMKRRMLCVFCICLAFCWLHVVFLPMLISALYAGYLLLLGRFVRERLLKVTARSPVFADFLLGSSLVIAEFCLLSACSAGGIPTLRAVSLVQGAVLYVWFLLRVRGLERDREQGAAFTGAVPAVLFTFMTVMVLIQIGKMNITLDYDTLWYGVRSEYILDAGAGIYENPGLVGMSYVYSKGLEVLLLPLSDLVSHSYLLFFNIWLAALGLLAVYRIAGLYMGRNYALLAAACVSAVPGVMNMSISAKPDIITWLLQLIMLYYFLCYVEETGENAAGGTHTEKPHTEKPVRYLIMAAGAYLLSMTMKPTALVFSTAVFGMAGLYVIFTRTVSLKAPLRHWLYLLPPAAALTGIWARTMLITGMPVMSVFTSIFAKLGFRMKYPFAVGTLPQNWQDESNLHVLIRRLYRMLLAPEGKDMGHVVIAWGTSLLFFLAAVIFLTAAGGALAGRNENRRKAKTGFAHVVFWPFLAVNLVSLVMLYQVDGNYFMLLYTAVILFACGTLERIADAGLRRLTFALLIPVFALNVLISAESNWAWAMGFTDISLLNSGRMNHEAMQREDMVNRGNAAIWGVLAADSKNRVIAFGTHPVCLEFPCNVQSYKDVTSPWGNVELVNSPEAFKEYLRYAETDYIYAEAGYLNEEEENWGWSYGLLKDLIRSGALTDLFFEDGNMLARVSLDDPLTPEEGAANLRLFSEQYREAGQQEEAGQ